MNNGPEHINEHAIYLKEACNQLQAVGRGRHNQVPWNVVQQYLDSTIVLVGKVLRQPALREILQQVKDAAKCTQNIQHDVAIIKNSVGLSTAPLNTTNFSRKAGATWAHVAAHAKGSMPIPPPAPQDTLASETQSSVTAYKDRIVTVKLKDKGISERHRAQSAAWTKHQVETSVQANTATRAVKIVAAYQLKSGDIQVIASTTAEATQLKEHQGWLSGLGEHAELIVPTYGVIVHGISTKSINVNNQEATIQQMLADNYTVIPDAKVKHVGWLTKEAHLKRASSIVAEFTEPEMANAVIYAGLVWDNQVHQCQLYDRTCRVKQCFRCYNYGHIGTQCNLSQVCGYCAERHESKHCKHHGVEGFTPRCAVCKGSHTAWSNACPARRKELQRVEQAKEARSIYWHVPAKGATATSATQRTGHVNIDEEENTSGQPAPTRRSNHKNSRSRGAQQPSDGPIRQPVVVAPTQTQSPEDESVNPPTDERDHRSQVNEEQHAWDDVGQQPVMAAPSHVYSSERTSAMQSQEETTTTPEANTAQQRPASPVGQSNVVASVRVDSPEAAPDNPLAEQNWTTPMPPREPGRELIQQELETDMIDPQLLNAESYVSLFSSTEDQAQQSIYPQEPLEDAARQGADVWLQDTHDMQEDGMSEGRVSPGPSTLTSLATDARTAQGQIFKGCNCRYHQVIYSDWPTHDADLTISQCMRICTYCGKDFTMASKLRKHMKVKHADRNITVANEKRGRGSAITPGWSIRHPNGSPSRRPRTRLTRSQSLTDSAYLPESTW